MSLVRGTGLLAALSVLSITLAAPVLARAQTAPEPSRFTIGGSLVGAFGPESVLMPAVRASVQLTARVGLDFDMGASTRATDAVCRAG